MARTTAQASGAREAVIGRTTRVRGRVFGDGDLVVEGNVEGDITLRGDLTDCLIGHLFRDFNPLFTALSDFATLPAALHHGGPLLTTKN